MTRRSGIWRVVLARAPATADAHAVIDAIGGSAPAGLPRSLKGELSWQAATDLVDQLRAVGADAAVMPEGTACETHPAEIAGRNCALCDRPICAECRAASRGAAICPNCRQRATELRRARRLRNLFAIFLFSVFLFEVASYLRREADALVPPVKVVIVEFAPPELMASPALLAMNQPDDGAGRSLYDIGAFYQQEYTRYTGGGDAPISVTIRGPFATQVHPPVVLDREPPWWKLLWTAWQYPRYFHGLARDEGIEPDDFGARMYVVWSNASGDVAGDSRGSRKGRVGIAFLSTDEPNLGYSVVSVAHELCHILGAVDNYDEGSFLSHWPEGYVEPFATPLWPQHWAELMAVDRPTGPTEESEVQSLFDVRIGYDTAARIGWIASEQAKLYYSPRLTMPEETLHQIERARARVAPAQSVGARSEGSGAAAQGPDPQASPPDPAPGTDAAQPPEPVPDAPPAGDGSAPPVSPSP